MQLFETAKKLIFVSLNQVVKKRFTFFMIKKNDMQKMHLPTHFYKYIA